MADPRIAGRAGLVWPADDLATVVTDGAVIVRITEQGLYRDIYRDGEKIRSEAVSPPIPANEGFDAAEEDLRENVEGLVRGLRDGTE